MIKDSQISDVICNLLRVSSVHCEVHTGTGDETRSIEDELSDEDSRFFKYLIGDVLSDELGLSDNFLFRYDELGSSSPIMI